MFPVSGRSCLRALIGCALAVFLGASCSHGQKQASSRLEEDAPSKLVTFFMAESCPAGWLPAHYAQGRLIVGVTKPELVGKQVGQAPLTDQEDRKHKHTFSPTVSLPYKSVSAAYCCNNQGAKADTYAFSGNTDESTSGLPFIQLRACEKQ